MVNRWKISNPFRGKDSVGPEGPPGRDGINGIDGNPGTPGRDGADGKDGVDGSPGAPGLPGTPGTNGTNGVDGTNGLKGDQGIPGTPGAPGTPGVTIRIVRLSLTSNASGIITATYSPAFAATPNVHLELLSTNNRQIVRLTASSATGFTAVVESRNAVLLSLLGIDILAAGVTVVNGASVRATVVEA